MNPAATHKARASLPLIAEWQPAQTRRSQREVLLELLRSAAKRDAWLTLEEMAAVTNFPPASISAQLRHLRKPMYGAWKIRRQQRKWATSGLLWEYRLGS